MTTTIIHVSDTHFGNESPTYDREEIKKALIESINNEEGRKILVISGDITYKARPEGYKEASAFFSDVIKQCEIDRSSVIACPGNHDICRKTTFAEFDSFIYSLRRDKALSAADNNESIVKIGSIVFIICNSSHHLDHTYGLIPDSTIELLNKNRQNILDAENRIFITHHHPINQHKNDTSTIRNTHKLLYTLDPLNFDYLLHGHQHSSTDITFGKNQTKILSARSLNFHDRGYHNGFNAISIETGSIKRFIVSPDQDPTKLTFKEIK
ncbi:3',5'-cyclic adenosine monophosphate phosphodiesterase CpdA [compost metagenome]